MLNLSSFIRSTPPELLCALAAQVESAIELPPPPAAATPDWKRCFQRTVEGLSPQARSKFEHAGERIVALSDEPGEVAIFDLRAHKDALEALPHRRARAAWLLINDPTAFRRAEDIRFTDENRRGRKWSGFEGVIDGVVQRDDKALEAFKSALRVHFESPNVHVEVFDRHRPDLRGGDTLVQVTIYREGRPNETLEFVEGTLGTRIVRPVIEAAITYDNSTGEIEVVSQQEQNRQELARIFCRDLLQAETRNEKLPLRQYDLQVLTGPQTFPTDPADGIESVRVGHLRLMPISTGSERVTLESMSSAQSDVWRMSQKHFGSHDPLIGGWRVINAKLIVRFCPAAGSNRRRTLPVTITAPHRCDLKERTEKERLIGSKYLRRWGLVQEI